MDTGHWEYHTEFNPEDHMGFIYKITCKVTGVFYIGRKQLFSTIRKPPLKGYKRKRKVVSESKWKSYTSSSTFVNELIAKDKANFKFEILQLCNSKSELAYYEAFWIITSGSMTSELGLNYQCPRIPCKPKPPS